jgi:hypothetical protein
LIIFDIISSYEFEEKSSIHKNNNFNNKRKKMRNPIKQTAAIIAVALVAGTANASVTSGSDLNLDLTVEESIGYVFEDATTASFTQILTTDDWLAEKLAQAISNVPYTVDFTSLNSWKLCLVGGVCADADKNIPYNFEYSEWDASTAAPTIGLHDTAVTGTGTATLQVEAANDILYVDPADQNRAFRADIPFDGTRNKDKGIYTDTITAVLTTI